MYKISDSDSWKVIQIPGNMTADTADAFRNLLLELSAGSHYSIRFDFSDVEDIDAMILNIFAVFSDMLKKFPDACSEIIHANDDIANLFRMTHLDRTYQII